ncbi:C4-dicarboxylate ABC transporter substrate-binding protein [Ramlibacter rhizophilus]|uniref:C4-dicarboxylate ABC transporter substrate-binding protein n=2 Tax=Ramlibacter rhizophilus TaxID=1781167 RepID=A0A4Z0BUL5_9BURK|nr:C4-dicarboxylate ABC transporter substrate-binding protein [Ramlibacter rhizophilus]
MKLNRRILLSACAAAAWVALPAQSAERWNMSAEQPDGNYITGVAKSFAEDVAKATKGELEIKVHSNSVLFKRPELKRAVQTGQVPIGDVLVSVLGNEDPIYEVDAVPLLATDFDAAWKLWQASKPAMEQRLAKQGIKLLYSVPWPPQGIYTKVPVKSTADFKGMKFRAYNAATSRLVELMGASPTTVNSGDVPQAFGTGLIEAMITSPATGVDSQAWDFSKYYYDVQAFIPKNVTIMNARAFARLSPASQKAVMEAAAAAEKRGWEEARKQTATLTQTLAKNGMVVGKTPPALGADLEKIGATMADEWLKKAGADGKAVLDAARR